MIQVKIYLDEKTPLFKNLKKRGFLDSGYNDTIFIWLNLKPCIGELIEIGPSSVEDKRFTKFLHNRNKRLVLRITDLRQSHVSLNSIQDGIDSIYLKCIEDDSINWF